MDREELKQILVKFCTPNEYGVDPDDSKYPFHLGRNAADGVSRYHKNVRCDYFTDLRLLHRSLLLFRRF